MALLKALLWCVLHPSQSCHGGCSCLKAVVGGVVVWSGGGVVVWSGGVSKCQTDMLDKPGFHDSLRVAAHCPRNFYRLVAKHDSATFFICRATLLY